MFTILGVIVATGLVAGFVDLSRPANERTHVGRFFEKIGEDGPAGFFTVIGRKLGLMIGTFSNTAWVLLVLSVVILVALAFRRTDVMTRLFARVPTLRPGLVCVAVLVVLATALNDSGVQVTGMMRGDDPADARVPGDALRRHRRRARPDRDATRDR